MQVDEAVSSLGLGLFLWVLWGEKGLKVADARPKHYLEGEGSASRITPLVGPSHPDASVKGRCSGVSPGKSLTVCSLPRLNGCQEGSTVTTPNLAWLRDLWETAEEGTRSHLSVAFRPGQRNTAEAHMGPPCIAALPHPPPGRKPRCHWAQ